MHGLLTMGNSKGASMQAGSSHNETSSDSQPRDT